MEHFLQIVGAVRQAAELCQHIQKTDVAPVEKPGREPVTIADFGSQAVICRAIRQYYPNDAVVSEEQGAHFKEKLSAEQRHRIVALVGEVVGTPVTEDEVVSWLDHGKGRDTELTWVIDPIDGTRGFLGQRSYTIAVGLLKDRKPFAGILGSPGYPNSDGKIFFAHDGKAYTQDLGGNTPTEIRVSENVGTGGFVVVESVESKHAAHDTMAQIYADAGIATPIVKRVDGQDKYAMIAMGDADLYLRVSPQMDYKEKVWDHAAGVALIEAAGGQVTDMNGQPLDFTSGDTLINNTFVVVSNKREHDNIIKALQSAYQA